jgi:hypothetical protein
MTQKPNRVVDAVEPLLTASGLAFALASVGIAIGYHLVLARKGLDVGELWGSGKIPGWSIPTGTDGLISLGNACSLIGLRMGVASIVLSPIGLVARLALKRPCMPLLCLATTSLGILGGFLCLHIICTLGGI